MTAWLPPLCHAFLISSPLDISEELQKCLEALKIGNTEDSCCLAAVEQTFSLLETQGKLFTISSIKEKAHLPILHKTAN